MKDYSDIPIKFIVAGNKSSKTSNTNIFQVGNYVTAISHDRYNITNDECVCKVLSLDYEHDSMDVQVCFHSDVEKKMEIGNVYSVEISHFRPYL